jgi:UDP-N-acetylglucosamine--N-acetylmuramyl-(pentapeptide) pyrophosphoryl-undecaprenol N-acetylglucosamine transferase
MRVLFTGGGTAGHINPALAAAGYLKKKNPDAEILFIGNRGGMEERLVPAAGYNMKTIHISGFQRKRSMENLKKNIRTLQKIITSSVEAKKILSEFKPDVCVGTGGYVSGPVLLEASRMGIPCVEHESNAYPGITEKLLARRMNAVMLAVGDASAYFGKNVNTVVTGNPVREELLAMNKDEARKSLGIDERPLVLSFGGSLGAAKINEAMVTVLAESSKSGKYQHIHGYGQHDQQFIPKLTQAGVTSQTAPQIKVLEYIDNMAECMAAADLVICRCGAITLTEVEALGKASILIPSTNVAENHQYHNGMALVNHGAATMIEEKDLDGYVLWKKIDELLSDKEKLNEYEKNASEMYISDANERIYQQIIKAADSKKN